MISIIICSQNPALLHALEQNIAATVGTNYELLAVDNRNNFKGISSVYNQAARQAKYGIMCFMHEDVCLHTKGWGQVLVDILADESIGLVGISGAIYKSKYPGTWSACDSSLYRTHSIQHFKNAKDPVETNINPLNEKFAAVSVIDGVMMTTTKKVFKQYQFDDKLLNSFHGYDLDYSLQVGQSFKVAVSYDILLEHFSEGKLSQAWLENSIAVHKKFVVILPKYVCEINDTLKKKSDFYSLECALNVALKTKGNTKLVLNFYCMIQTLYFKLSKFRYSKTLIYYIFKNLFTAN